MNSWLWSPSSKGSPTAGCWQCRAAGVERFERHNAENIPCLGDRALREAAGLGLPQGCVSAKETSFFLVTPQSAHSRSPACFSKLIQTLYIDTRTERCVCLCIHPRIRTQLLAATVEEEGAEQPLCHLHTQVQPWWWRWFCHCSCAWEP